MIYRAFSLTLILVVAFIPAVVGAQSFPVGGGFRLWDCRPRMALIVVVFTALAMPRVKAISEASV